MGSDKQWSIDTGRVNMQKMSERPFFFLMMSLIARTLFYYRDSLQNTIHTVHMT